MHTRIPVQELEKWLSVKNGEHTTEGNLDLAYGDAWLPDIGDIFTAAQQSGHRVNPDVNSGDLIGMGMGTVCIAKGIRATSASAYLSRPPPNLKILVDSPITRIMIEGKRVVGVETIDGRRLRARNEVIVSGGALNTPQILMLSGIGPSNELEKHDIAVLKDTPLVGKNLQEICFAAVGIVLEKDPNLPPGPDAQSPTPMGWFKLPAVTTSSEF